ncbi:uncharacterized protein LOC123028390 isoform X1 [Varanus komodoensis]|uniref:uncharacterized protein LOC123028390 isoform X1 n=1 Tax=Varanus komodoensis TaxID=61221 RepID=UPI001CF776D0|nr:uncharacterized protein LOC123028390 isoform X1 [Varanus komodoensis]
MAAATSGSPRRSAGGTELCRPAGGSGRPSCCTWTRSRRRYLRDDPADGGLKDCVWLDAGTGLLHDARCEEERPFLCKAAEGLDRFEEWPGRGVAGDPGPLFPSAEGLAQARQACLLHRRECAAVLQTGSGFYLLASTEGLVPRADSTLFVWTICAEGFAGPACRTTLARAPRPACDCSGRLQTSAGKVCGVPVQACVDDCRRVTSWANCSACLPSCTEASVSQLEPEQLALVAMARWRMSRSLNLTTEDKQDRGSSSRIIYDTGHP